MIFHLNEPKVTVATICIPYFFILNSSFLPLGLWSILTQHNINGSQQLELSTMTMNKRA